MAENKIYPDLYRKNLRLLFWLRLIAIAGQSVTVFFTTHILLIPLPNLPIWGIIASLGVINFVTYLRLKTAAVISQRELLAHLLVDIGALYGLLYFSGGASNPFASLFIIQVMIAAIIMPPFYTWWIALLTIALYTLLLFWNVEVPYFLHHHIGSYFNIHVQGMWMSFVLLALLVAGFIMRISSTVRRQDQLLAQAEHLAALGALAAGAAHELGTPLATISLLAQQYEAEARNDDAQKRAVILREQVGRCKGILTRITAAAGVMRAETGKPLPLDQFLRGIITRWQNDRPQVQARLQIGGLEPAPVIVGEYSIEQAIMNVLNNAADASPQAVEVVIRWDAMLLHIAIRDYGKGMAGDIIALAGTPGITSKPEGMGLGLFLARSVLARLEGSLDIANHKDGGVLATLRLPLEKLRV